MNLGKAQRKAQRGVENGKCCRSLREPGKGAARGGSLREPGSGAAGSGATGASGTAQLRLPQLNLGEPQLNLGNASC